MYNETHAAEIEWQFKSAGIAQPSDWFWQLAIAPWRAGGTAAIETVVAEEVAETVVVQATEYVVQNTAGFYIRASSSFANGVYTKTIQTLAAVSDKTNIFTLLRSLEAEAVSNGANKIVINGVDIVETSLFNPTSIQRLGYTYQRTSANSMTLTKILK